MVPKLPPTLYMHIQLTITRCSKAPRGLSVLLHITRIFTGATISPSFSLRQFPSRYAFHAGRYLADKEFRYLRTVRVTAAVYWAFDSMPRHLLLGFQYRAGVRPYTSCYHFAESCVFNKQSPLLILCQHTKKRKREKKSLFIKIFDAIPSSKVTGSICRVP